MSAIDHPRTDVAHAEVVPLSAIPTGWDDAWYGLADRASEPNSFGEAWFMRASVRHLSVPESGRMVAVWQGPELIGLLPLFCAPRYGRMAVCHVENWLHYNNFLGTPLIRSGRETAFWRAALAVLDAADWAPAFLHLTGLAEDGAVLRGLRDVRRADTVHRSERAMLATDLSPQAYYEAHVRKKKRKEIGRLKTRLAELGPISCTRLARGDALAPWTDAFLALEASGWKGRDGAALTNSPDTRAFFLDATTEAHRLGRLEILRLCVGARTIGMLVNFLAPPGSFSFKIAFDEEFARFSPGVLIQLENLTILDRTDIAWMDSCAVEDHSMINSLWAERRAIVRVTVPLAGLRRRATFSACRSLENAAALVRRLT